MVNLFYFHQSKFKSAYENIELKNNNFNHSLHRFYEQPWKYLSDFHYKTHQNILHMYTNIILSLALSQNEIFVFIPFQSQYMPSAASTLGHLAG